MKLSITKNNLFLGLLLGVLLMSGCAQIDKSGPAPKTQDHVVGISKTFEEQPPLLVTDTKSKSLDEQ